MKESNDIEKLLKDNLSDKTAVVPEFVWDRIEREIYPRKKGRSIFWFLIPGILLLTGATFGFFAMHDEHRKNAGSAVVNHPSKEVAETINEGTQDVDREFQRKADANLSRTKQQSQSDVRIKSTAFQGSTADFREKQQERSIGVKALPALGNGNILAQPGKRINTDNAVPPLENMHQAESDGFVPQEDTASFRIAQLSLLGVSPFVFPAERIEHAVNAVPELQKRDTRFTLSIYGGSSMYDVAVIKPYFTSGQLSNRTFTSTGYEAGAGFAYKAGKRLEIYAGVAFNEKRTSFNYNLAITESDFFERYVHGEMIPLKNINDDGVNSCFLAKDVAADYGITSWLLSIGGTYRIFTQKKFTASLDLRFSTNVKNSLEIKNFTVLELPEYAPEHFNRMKLGGGLRISYQFHRHFSAGLAPMYAIQLDGKESFFAGRMQELIIPVTFSYHF